MAHLELEIDERLDGAALHLYDDVDDKGDESGIDDDIAFAHEPDDAILPAVGEKMAEIAEEHEKQHVFVTSEHLRDELGMEVGEDLLEHDAHA